MPSDFGYRHALLVAGVVGVEAFSSSRMMLIYGYTESRNRATKGAPVKFAAMAVGAFPGLGSAPAVTATTPNPYDTTAVESKSKLPGHALGNARIEPLVA